MYALGTLKDQYHTVEGIKVSKHEVKCLGIYIGHDKIECYNKNWMNVYHNIEKLFESWKKRKLTLFGKRTIVNTLAIPKLIYIATILELPDENYLKKLNRTIFNFIWNTTERIKRNTVIGEISEGGIGLIDLESKLRSLKAAWVSRLLKTKHVINDFVNSFCRVLDVDITYVANTSETNIKRFDIVQKMPLFYKEVFSCLNISKQKISLDTCTTELFLTQTIWSNKNITHKGKSFCFSNWVKSGIIYIKHLFNENGRLKTLNEFSTIIQNKSNWLCEYKIIQDVFKKYEHKFNYSIIPFTKDDPNPAQYNQSTKYFYSKIKKIKITNSLLPK